PFESGSWDALSEPGTVLIHKGPARALGLGIGDDLPVTFARTGKQQLKIVGIYTDNRLLGDYTTSLAEYEENVAEQLDFLVFVRAAAGVPPERARSGLHEVARGLP